MVNLTNDEAQGINNVCPMASKYDLGERIKNLEEKSGVFEGDAVTTFASSADASAGTNTTKAINSALLKQETDKRKVKQMSATGVDVDATIPCVNNGVGGVMAFVTATGAFVGLLDLTTDYTVQATTITCKTDQQLNTLVITYN